MYFPPAGSPLFRHCTLHVTLTSASSHLDLESIKLESDTTKGCHSYPVVQSLHTHSPFPHVSSQRVSGQRPVQSGQSAVRVSGAQHQPHGGQVRGVVHVQSVSVPATSQSLHCHLGSAVVYADSYAVLLQTPIADSTYQQLTIACLKRVLNWANVCSRT